MSEFRRRFFLPRIYMALREVPQLIVRRFVYIDELAASDGQSTPGQNGIFDFVGRGDGPKMGTAFVSDLDRVLVKGDVHWLSVFQEPFSVPDSDDKMKKAPPSGVSPEAPWKWPCRKHVKEGAPLSALLLVPSYKSFHGFRETTLAASKRLGSSQRVCWVAGAPMARDGMPREQYG